MEKSTSFKAALLDTVVTPLSESEQINQFGPSMTEGASRSNPSLKTLNSVTSKPNKKLTRQINEKSWLHDVLAFWAKLSTKTGSVDEKV